MDGWVFEVNTSIQDFKINNEHLFKDLIAGSF